MIYNPKQAPLVNHYAFPEAWFVSEAQSVTSPDDALAAISTTDLKSVAILEDAEDATFTTDSLASIRQTVYAPDCVTYQSNSSSEGLAVFSEIYYPAGWVATIDGTEAPILRADYTLRALRIPAGNHTIEFSFRPKSFIIGNNISTVASIVVVLLVIAAAVVSLREARKV